MPSTEDFRADIADALFEATDCDGDTFTIEQNPNGLIFTVYGEDGHRSMLMSEEDMARLATFITNA